MPSSETSSFFPTAVVYEQASLVMNSLDSFFTFSVAAWTLNILIIHLNEAFFWLPKFGPMLWQHYQAVQHVSRLGAAVHCPKKKSLFFIEKWRVGLVHCANSNLMEVVISQDKKIPFIHNIYIYYMISMHHICQYCHIEYAVIHWYKRSIQYT